MTAQGGAGTAGTTAEDLIRQGTAPSARGIEGVVRGEEHLLGSRGVVRRAHKMCTDLLGLGPLEEWVSDPAVTDLLVNGDGSVWVERGAGVERVCDRLGDSASVRRLATRLAGLAGRRLDDAQPFVDGLLPDGSRLHALLPPLVHGGPHISLRIPRHQHRGLDDLAALGMLTPEQVAQLTDVIANRRSFVITGGTGTGKTTLLSAMLACCPPLERLLVVEDVSEMSVAHPHAVRLQARSANTEGAGRVSMAELVRQALRMRPDRVVVGEVRGAEVRDLLMALNTGHEGGCGTLHANAAADVPARLEALGALAGMSPEATRSQVRSALDVVIHLRRDAGVRRVSEVVDVDSLVSR